MRDLVELINGAEPVDVLAVGAHRDDVELTVGGTILKLVAPGKKVGIVDLTEGEMGTRGTVEQRAQEARCAAQILGVSCRFNLGLPDGNVTITPEAVEKVIAAMRATKPKLVLAPYWVDRHPDHAVTGELVQMAAFRAGFAKWDTGQPHHRPSRIFYYMCHHQFTPSFVVDVSEQWEKRSDAIACYSSQLFDPTGMDQSKDAATFISSPAFLRHIETRAQFYGDMIAAEFAEPFFSREMIRMDDVLGQASASVERYAGDSQNPRKG